MTPPAREASLARSRFHARLGATMPTALGYLPLVLLPAAFLSRPAGEFPRWQIWAPALVGLVAAPLWSLAAEAVRGDRPRSPRGPDRDALRRDQEKRLIERSRMAVTLGLAGSYTTLIAGGILLTAAHAIRGTTDSNETSYWVMLPGLAVAVVAPFVPRLVGLGRHLRWALTEPRSRRSTLVERDGAQLVVRLEGGETVVLDAASTSGRGADASALPATVWLAGGAVPPAPAHPYQGSERTLHGAQLDTASDRSFRRRAVAALLMELAVLPVVPAVWLAWLTR